MNNSFKSYMDYRSITDTTSSQWKLLNSGNIIVSNDGLLRDADGYIGIAIGTYYCDMVGERFIITLDSGNEIHAIVVDIKADKDTFDGANHKVDSSMIEFVIDIDQASNYYKKAIVLGNFDAEDEFHGNIVKIEKIVEGK